MALALPNVRDSGQTFEIPGERSRFRANVRDSIRTLEIPAECSKYGILETKSTIKGQQKGLPEFLVEAKFIF